MAKGNSSSTIEEAVKNNDGNRIKMLVSQIDEEYDDLVHLAVSCNCKDALSALLESGCSANVMDKNFRRPIQVAIISLKFDLIPILLKHGGSMDVVSRGGETLLHCVAREGSSESAKCCLKINRGLIDKGNYSGETPLHVASSADNFEVVKVLIVFKANLNAKDIYGRAPLHIAKGRSFDMLLSAGADVNIVDNLGQAPLHIATGRHLKLLLSTGADVNMLNSYNQTPLYCAVLRGSLNCSKTIISNSLDINDYVNPLVKAVASGRVDIVELLIMAGADVRTNSSVLIKAAIDNNQDKILQALLEHGADANIKLRYGFSNFNSTTLSYAEKVKSNQKIINILKLFFL